MNKKIYYATAEGHINGKWRKAGDPVGELTDREAKYLELAGTISTTKPEDKADKKVAPEPDPAVLERKTR